MRLLLQTGGFVWSLQWHIALRVNNALRQSTHEKKENPKRYFMLIGRQNVSVGSNYLVNSDIQNSAYALHVSIYFIITWMCLRPYLDVGGM